MKRDRMCETTQVPNLKQRLEMVKSVKGDLPVFS
jgi:hypothetical protein